MRTVHLSPTPHFTVKQHDGDRETQTVVITPNPRAARFLGTRSQTLDSVAEAVLNRAGISVASDLVAYRLLRESVRETISTADPEGVTRAWQPALRTLFHAVSDLRTLQQFPSVRVQQVGQLARAYQSHLRTHRYVDPAEALFAAANLPPQRRQILVYGYPRLGTDEMTFIEAVAGDGSHVYLPDGESTLFQENVRTAKLLAESGWTITYHHDVANASARREMSNVAGFGDMSHRSDKSPASDDVGVETAHRFTHNPARSAGEQSRVKAYIYPHLEAEVRGTLAQVKKLLQNNVPPTDIVIVARDDATYGPTALAVAWEYGVPLRALYGVPLTETRLGAWLHATLQAAVDGFPYEATLHVLGHPFGPGLGPDALEGIRKTHPSGRERWEAMGVNLDKLAYPERDTRGAFVTRLRNLLESYDVRKKAVQRSARDAIAFQRLFAALTDPLMPPGETITVEQFVAEVSDTLTILIVPVEPGRGGVELHTPLSLIGARYRYVFVLGLAEGVLPRPSSDDAVLDFFERKRLANEGFPIETPVAAAHREELSFWSTLVAAQDELVLSYPRLYADREALASPYLAKLGLSPTGLPKPENLPLASPEEALRSLLHASVQRESVLLDLGLVETAKRARHGWQIEWHRENGTPPNEYDGIVGLALDPQTHWFSASQLVDIGQCPFKWLAARALKLAEPDEAEPDLAPDLRGSLYHKTLDIAVRLSLGHADLRASILAHLEDAFREAETSIQLPPLPSWEARRAEHLTILRRAVQGADFVDDEAAVLETEATFRGNWNGLRVVGVVDRLDRTATGLRLVDYKTSGSRPAGAKGADGKATLDVQLPLYIQVAAPVLYPGEGEASAYYYSLTKGTKLKDARPDSPVLEAFAERVKDHLRKGRYPVEPDLARIACKYCPYDLVCRQGPRLEWRRKLTADGETE